MRMGVHFLGKGLGCGFCHQGKGAFFSDIFSFSEFPFYGIFFFKSHIISSDSVFSIILQYISKFLSSILSLTNKTIPLKDWEEYVSEIVTDIEKTDPKKV